MPEGDTVFRAARRLDRALAGHPVTVFDTVLASLASLPVPGAVVGRVVERVRATGKHLLLELSGDLILHTHLRMHGDWHLYRPGERWRARRADLRVLLGTPDWQAVGLRLPVAEWLTARGVDRHPILSTLGPDPLAERFDLADALARLRVRADTPIAEALLDQRAIAGVGNVFKSEILFAERVSPFAPVGAIDAGTLERVVATARRLLRLSVVESPWARGPRRTGSSLDPAGALLVYGRVGAPCRRCATPIEMRRTGPDARSTYWCPRCQAA